MDASTTQLFFPNPWDPVAATSTGMDSLEQFIDPSPVHSFPDFDLWLQPQSSSFTPNNKTSDLALQVLQDQPGLSTTFSNLSLSDPLDMSQCLSAAVLQPLQPAPHTQLLSPTSITSSPLYEDALGLTWPTSDTVSFDDFDMQELSFLDVPFTTSTAATTTPTTTAALLLDYATVGDNNISNNYTSFTFDARSCLDYLLAPETQTPASMHSQLAIPTTPVPQLPHAVLAPGTNNNSVNPFRSIANVNDLFLPQIDTSFHPPLPPAETAPANLPLLCSTCPSTTISIPPSNDSLSGPVAPTSDSSAMVYPAMNIKSSSVQDTLLCQAYSPTTFLLDSSSLMVKRAAAAVASRQASMALKSNALSRRTSVSDAAGGLVRRTPYARPQYPQEPKKRRNLELDDDDDGESNNEGCLKLQRMAEFNGPNNCDHITPSRSQLEQSFLRPMPLPPYHSCHDPMQRPTSPSEQKSNGKGKGRRPSLKKITDCAHYRPRNAFFMFRGFVSRIHSHLHAKQLSASSSSMLHSYASFFMTSTMMIPLRPNSTEKNNNNKSGDSTATSSSPTFISFFPTDTQQPHLSLPSLPPTTQSPSLPHPSTFSTRRRRQAQTKVSVSCGKIWSSPCLPTCRTGLRLGLNIRSSSGCANCRMRSLFRQASNYLKLRQTEIERLIEFPLSSPESEDPDELTSTTTAVMRGRKMLTRLEDSFNWKEFEQLYHHSDLFKWHRDYYTNHAPDNDNDNEAELNLEEMKAIWMENELAYEKAFSEGARKRIVQESLKATSGIANSSSSNKRTVLYH